MGAVPPSHGGQMASKVHAGVFGGDASRGSHGTVATARGSSRVIE